MKPVRIFVVLMSLALLLPVLAFAEGAGGTYRGIGTMYYTLIWVVLTYGLYDTFGKTAMYIVSPILAVAAYFLLPPG